VESGSPGSADLSQGRYELAAELEGVGGIDAEDLTTPLATVDISGVGDCYVTATDELNVIISGEGDVYYAGNPPVINSNITGNGNLIALR
jgi:hypothetical protein